MSGDPYYADRFLHVPDVPEIRQVLGEKRESLRKQYPGAAPVTESMLMRMSRATAPDQLWGFTHSQREQGPEASIFGMVPVHKLLPFRHYDRRLTEGGRANIEDVKTWLSGENGHQEPLRLEYDHNISHGLLGEGNHRLAAAIELGQTHVPVIVQRGPLAHNRSERQGSFLKINEHLMLPDDYKSQLAGHHVPYISPDMHPDLFPQLRGDH